VGVFAIQQEFDQEYVITTLGFARDIFQYSDEVSALEIKLDSTKNLKSVTHKISEIMGNGYVIKDRFQQDEAFLKLMNIEKWMSYAIVCLTLLLVSFNMIGALWMIVLDKRRDITILKSLGMVDRGIMAIFIRSGMLLCILGLFFGFILAIVLYILQKEVGLVTIPEGFVVETYPVSLRLLDFITVGITVLLIGWISSIPAARKASRVRTSMNE
jgi:lipoprotein-releasing system permease protein